MILAAGLGTRLKPITDRIPKALVEVEGVAMLERVIMTLKKYGFDYIVINVHHFSEQIRDFLTKKEFGVRIEISDESESLLDTGGGIVKASDLLFKENEQPVLIHNVDIISNANLEKLMEEANKTGSGILLVTDRESSRKLLFDDNYNLKGWHNIKSGEYRPKGIESAENLKELAFSGLYVLQKKEVEEMRKIMGEGKYSVIEYFLHPSRKENIKGMEVKDIKVLDIGKPATLSQASELLNAF